MTTDTDKQQQQNPTTPAKPPAAPAHGQPAERNVDREAPTQIGTVFEQLRTLTRRFQTGGMQGSTAMLPRPRRVASQDRIQQLIEMPWADPNHPEHATAVNQLVEIGTPALAPLCDALSPNHAWLTSYRAAEALGVIGDGRATGALIRALRHPNSNVRWNAVRALSLIGDLRAVIELRRVAHDDPGRTSWGESVASAAQSALDHLRSKSVWGQSVELVKTAITSVLMILALLLAFSSVTALREELARIGRTDVPGNVVRVIPPPIPTAENPDSNTNSTLPLQPDATEDSALFASPTPEPTTSPVITGTALQVGNVRPAPTTDNNPIGQVNEGDEIIFVARNAAGDWY
ncbi:MAG: HEAT repeat domain-containing protein, partial [Chloroflexaceae bacterium]|nr:HEAT repeat domain-containing protein [Chloroflexaceae bacterium]